MGCRPMGSRLWRENKKPERMIHSCSQNPPDLEGKMKRKVTAILSVLLFCVVIMAQEPVVDIDKNRHPNLAEAQRLVVEANHYIAEAQKDNRYDMKDHAERARQLLVQVNQELKAAAEAANAAMKK
ncbi:hypothetical protein SBA1_790003 [Candidatus Sulfotelmatobacter kueseliae]|uniref:Uncharacterized protein n=1 Tax=Candidatus Sulfotelmatobacter kueseliae TaxID=2042962 RepID=A0A2U3L7S2_9BACT|nr:hypothetical protein SBA1_790003 [Candidatus Sulfotelmatobacter kueseliae]